MRVRGFGFFVALGAIAAAGCAGAPVARAEYAHVETKLRLLTPPPPTPAWTAARESWTRTLAPVPQPPDAPPRPQVLLPLPNGSIVARDGEGVTALDRSGARRWTIPDVGDVIADGDALVMRRATYVFSVRARDAGVRWKHACANPSYVAAAGSRIATNCGGVSTILDARDGHTVARHDTTLVSSPPHLVGARSLNADYVLVANFFEGAWMGISDYVVDVRTGAFLWQETDARVLAVGPTTIDLTPLPSTMPWGTAGYVKRVRLSDGKVVGETQYAVPKTPDSYMGVLTESTAATYVNVHDGNLYRFSHHRTGEPQPLLASEHGGDVVTLDDAAFIFTRPRMHEENLFIDRPAGDGFTTRRLGAGAGSVMTRTDTLSDMATGVKGARVGDRIVTADRGMLHVYDRTGAETMTMTVASSCSPLVAGSGGVLLVACSQPGAPNTVTAYALR